uniref:DUF748 domain-containing protein n=1 Tax=Marinobacterium jannaschii TaxID=64970 RepID=UPI00048903B2|nr:DUF748 domain-containing protein [Marinobacterium jannaschii]
MRWLAGILITLLMVLHTLPYLVRDQIVIWLRDQGVEQVRLDALRLNWFSGRLQLKGFYAATEGREPLQLDYFNLKLNYGAMADKRLLVEQILIAGLKGGISQQDDQLWLGPLDLTKLGGEAEEAAPEAEPPPAEASDWSAGIGNISISDLDWKAQLDKQKHRLQLDQLALNHIYLWDQQRQTELLLQGRVNQAPFAIDTKAVPLPEHKTSAVKLKLDGFPLHSVTAAFEPRFEGLLDLDLSLAADLQGQDGTLKPEGLIRLRKIRWEDEAISLKQKQLSWQGNLELTLAELKPTRLVSDSALSLKGIGLKQAEQAVQLDTLGWKGTLDLALKDSLPSQLKAKGRIDLDKLKAEAAPAAQAASLNSLRWKGDLSLQMADLKPTRVRTDSGLELAGIGLQQPEQSLQLARIGWQGKLDLGLKDNVPQKLKANGNLGLDKLQVAMAEGQRSAALETLRWELGSELGFTEGHPSTLDSSHQLQLQGIQAAEARRKAQIGALALNADVASGDMQAFRVKLPQLQLDNAAVDGAEDQLISLQQLVLEQLDMQHTAQIDLQQLRLEGLKVAGDRQHLTDVKSLQVNQLQLADMQHLQIRQLLLRDSDSWVKLDKQAQLSDVEWLKQQLGLAESSATAASDKAGDSSGRDKATPATQEAQPMRVQLGQLLVSGSNKIHIRDRSVKPSYKSDIDLQRFSLSDIDTGAVQASPFELKARLEAFASLTAEGEIELMGEQHNGHWKANIEGLELPQLSPYALKHTGYYVRSGQLNLEASGKISKGVVNAGNKIRINRLDVEPGNKDKMAEFSKRLTMPLETAISVLQDKRDNISLDVPVKGPVNDLDFGYQSVINLLAKKGVKQAAMSYLSKALQPYGLLISLASTAMDARSNGTFITLQPVSFAAGSSKLDRTAEDYLVKIAGMLKERDAMRLNICGAVAPSDARQLKPALLAENKKRKKPLPADQIQEQLEQQLRTLAEKRGEQVKQRLLEEVKADRLYTCFVQVGDDPEAKPEVKLGL